jgi:hypothetical protein
MRPPDALRHPRTRRGQINANGAAILLIEGGRAGLGRVEWAGSGFGGLAETCDDLFIGEGEQLMQPCSAVGTNHQRFNGVV